MSDYITQLQDAIDERGISISELARRANVSRGYLYIVLAGKSRPTVDVLSRLSDALGIVIEAINPATDDPINLVPSPDELPEFHVPKPDYDKWFRTVLGWIGAEIRRNAKGLSEGEIVWHFPAVRDMGASLEMWREHYPDIVDALRRRGYQVQPVVKPNDIFLLISIQA